jgi:hypothetical protein
MKMKKKTMAKGGAMMKKKTMAKGGAMMKKKGYAKGGLPMTTVKGQKVPKFAADGKGANDMKKGMKAGGMAKKGYAMGGANMKMKKKAYAKGGKVMTYNLGGMVKSQTNNLKKGK